MAVDASISGLTGLPTDQVRLVLGNLLLIGLCFYLPKIGSVGSRKLFSTVLGSLIQTYIYSDQPVKLLVVFGMHVAVYMACKIFDRKDCGRNVTMFSMAVLSIYHVYRMVTDYYGSWRIDVATVFMMFVCKYSSFAFAYQDGATPIEQLSKEQRLNRVVELPSFYEYMAFIQFLPTAALGPSLEYREYERYILLQDQYANLPNRVGRVIQTFLEAIAWVAIYMLVYPHFHMDYMRTEAFRELAWWKIVLYDFASLTLLRSKYYFAWKLSSCSIDACGLSYNGKVKAENGLMVDDFSLIPNIDPWNFEMSPHFRVKVRSWNMSVQAWLTKCVYYRYRTAEQYEKNKGDQAKGQMLVYLTSAFWHGFYAGYYLSFFFWYFVSSIMNTLFRLHQRRPEVKEAFESLGFVGRVLAWFISSVAMTYFGSYFQLLSWKDSISFMSALSFFPNILVVVLALALQQIPLGPSKPRHHKEANPSGISHESKSEGQLKSQ